jgi:hypothetical protein
LLINKLMTQRNWIRIVFGIWSIENACNYVAIVLNRKKNHDDSGRTTLSGERG